MSAGSDAMQTKTYVYDMRGHAQGCVDRYLELSGKKKSDLKMVSTPNMDDHALTEADFVEKGLLSEIAAKAVLKILYLARMGRPNR